MKEKAVTSPRTALILLLLRREGALSTIQLSEHLGIPPRQVHGYLAYLRRRGIVRSNSYTHALTEYGVEYVDKYFNHLEYVVRRSFRLKIAKHSLTQLKKAKDIVEEIGRLHDLGECVGIVRFLVDFRLRTGRKYWWPGEAGHVEELAERLGLSSGAVGSCLRRLEAEGVIYMRLDQRRGVVKIRLGRQFDPLFEA